MPSILDYSVLVYNIMSEPKDRKRHATESLQTLDVLKKHHKFLRESDEE